MSLLRLPCLCGHHAAFVALWWCDCHRRLWRFLGLCRRLCRFLLGLGLCRFLLGFPCVLVECVLLGFPSGELGVLLRGQLRLRWVHPGSQVGGELRVSLCHFAHGARPPAALQCA